MSEDAKEFIAVFIIFWIAVGLLVGALKWKANDNEKDFMIEISLYETISINGEDYNTDEVTSVTSVTSHPGVYEEDSYEIILKDGTKVRFSANGYTLKIRNKNKGSKNFAPLFLYFF